jgi:hypothetical protein
MLETGERKEILFFIDTVPPGERWLCETVDVSDAYRKCVRIGRRNGVVREETRTFDFRLFLDLDRVEETL